MIRIALAAAVLALALAPPARAIQEYYLPNLFDVVDVAPDDVLNIRAEPNARAQIIATLAPDATGVEIVDVAPGGTWGRINAGERAGWVSMRYLAYQVPEWDAQNLPPNLACYGTEPFWSLANTGDGLRFSTPEAEVEMTLADVLETGIPRYHFRAIVAQAGMERLTAMLSARVCSDGMSDRAFGPGIDAILEGRAGTRLYRGCCSLAP